MSFLFIWLLLAPTPGATPRHREPVRAFRKLEPCPATGKKTGACPGWVVDHIVPLCAGGRDAPDNMAWQPYAESVEKDRLETALCRFIVRERAAARKARQ